MTCLTCHVRPAREGRATCFRCHVASISFTFHGAHLGKRSWHDATVAEERRAIYAGAKRAGVDIERVR